MKVSNFSLDWLAFTFKKSGSLDLLSDFWDSFPEFTKFKSEMFIVGGRNFAHGLCLNNNVTIRYDDDSNGKGINVEIPSHGLNYFFSLFSDVSSVQSMFRILRDRGCSLSRVDICFDDFSKKYKPSYYYKKFLSGALVTKMRTVKMVHSGDGKGETFYLGDRRKKMLRVYDKSVESNGEIDAIRYEIEMHANAANGFFMHVIESNESEVAVFGDCFLDICDVRRVSKTDSDKSRWEKNKKWFDFIKSTFSQRFIHIPAYKPNQNAESIEKHVSHNYSAFKFVVALHGLEAVLKELAQVDLNPSHLAILKQLALDRGFEQDYYIKRCLLLTNNGKGVIKF